MPGTLFLVGTPIGNLEDMSPRAARVLREAAVIAAEDTRRTMNLLNHFGIKTPMLSYHRHNERERAAEFLGLLEAGKSVALVTDAGLPGVSDPGEVLVRAAVESGVPVVPVPGPSACLLALAASGLPSGGFRFAGFLPRRGPERRAALELIGAERGTSILYEAPHRLVKTLEDLRDTLGGQRRVAVARELTKVHEEFWRGTLADALIHYAEAPVRGEITLVLEGRGQRETREGEVSLEDALSQVQRLVDEEESLMGAVRRTSRRSGIAKNVLYRAYLARKRLSRKDEDGQS